VFTLSTLAVASAATTQEHPGAEPYELVCQSCHGEKGRGDIAPPLVPLEYDADYVLAIVREGYGQMPPISTRELTDEQVRQVASYLASILEEAPEPNASRAEDAPVIAYR
jgi:mono/diheme cytochrome c family protein